MILVFDWETTGLTLHPDADPLKQPQAIEFGGMYLSPSSGRIIQEFSFLIKPDEPVSEEITKITGITNVMLQYEPSFKHRLPEVRNIFAGATCMIAHNLPFDRAILRGELVRLGLNPDKDFMWPAKALCTVGLYREAWGRNPRLIELYENTTGKKYEQTHRGLDDVRALVELVQHDRLWELAE